MRDYQKGYYTGTRFDLGEICEMIAWYLSGAKNKDICAAYHITAESFRSILNRYHVPRKVSYEHRQRISQAARVRAASGSTVGSEITDFNR